MGKFIQPSVAQESSDESNPPLPKVTSKTHTEILEINLSRLSGFQDMNKMWCPQRCAAQISLIEKLVDRAQLPLLWGHCGTSSQASLSPGCSQLMTKLSRIYWNQATYPVGPLQWATLAPGFLLHRRGFLITLPPQPSILPPCLSQVSELHCTGSLSTLSL